MIAISSDGEPSWNIEGEDLAFLRDEGLELLRLFKSIKDEKQRKLIIDIIRLIAGEPADR